MSNSSEAEPAPARMAVAISCFNETRSEVSLMPNGLAQGLGTQDFAGLIADLETLKSVKD